ncbi:MAG: alpha/beta hydrolase [Patescibacteria group bacterium]
MNSRRKQAKTRSDLVNVYILHGWSYSLDKWQPFVSQLKNKKLNPVLLKIPGLTEKINKPWTIEDYINWLNEKIEKEDKVILLGHSNGGRIAMNFALAHPAKVKKLILIDSAGIYHDEIAIKIKRKAFGTIAKLGRKILKNDFGKKLLYSLARETDYKDADENMKKTMVNLLSSDKILKAENISTPTVILWGEKDRITPVSDAKLLESKIVNSKLLIVTGARHAPQFTHPKEVVDIIIKQYNN